MIDRDSIEYIDNIEIKNLFSIENIRLSKLKEKKEVYIVGNNGDGKTLFLQAIAVGLKGIDEDGLKEFRKKKNEFTVNILNKEKIGTNFFAYGSSRYNFCKSKEDKAGYLTLFSGEYDLKEPTEWLIELYNAQNANEPTVISLDDAIKLLQKMLNRDIEITVSYNSVTFKEKLSNVTFEQLSAGYRGVITIICDVIDRFSKQQEVDKISEFKGVIVIDEVELHLHPKWQYSFIQKLRETFPKVQFIVTTHSPTVLLGASIDAVYYQIIKKEGVITISNQLDINNDFLNDIQSNIFGFDVNNERMNNMSDNDKNRQKRAKNNLLNLIKMVKEDKS